jgi:hypothetical protein
MAVNEINTDLFHISENGITSEGESLADVYSVMNESYTLSPRKKNTEDDEDFDEEESDDDEFDDEDFDDD